LCVPYDMSASRVRRLSQDERTFLEAYAEPAA
jgi:hypothetical protein